MILTSATGNQSPVVINEAPKVEVRATKEYSKKEIEAIMSTEEYIKKYFSDIPIMIEIAKCESTFRHLEKDGNVRRGYINSKDVGVMQINEHYHLSRAIKENYDIYTIEGNTAYARKLYEEKGTQPWNSSKPCWGKHESNLALAINNK